MRIEYQGIVLRGHGGEGHWRLAPLADGGDRLGGLGRPLGAFCPHRGEGIPAAGAGQAAKDPPDHRLRLEIDAPEGVHIGAVSAYRLDNDYNWSASSGGGDDRQARWALALTSVRAPGGPAAWGPGLYRLGAVLAGGGIHGPLHPDLVRERPHGRSGGEVGLPGVLPEGGAPPGSERDLRRPEPSAWTGRPLRPTAAGWRRSAWSCMSQR